MSSLATRQLFHITSSNSQEQICPFRSSPVFLTNKTNNSNRFFNISDFPDYKNLTVVVKAAAGDGRISPTNQDDEDGVSLETMKLPLYVDLARFETPLFQV
ncbi:PREDICTED: uncharacterized protein LOC109234994 isoform X2 [Nicotiana attenuata]|uniref:Uncharacterized protein n=2 Tax=Nicotiana attenuata TaxID=49451 RepID=A0A1J6HWY0_NICAT|nr:PREDICTED: uncharacterized protein LOC109234994 isoform X2 [Nicotiana attenuata]OIS96827.1 hypothetical protein A4A49_02568 [Nicotiana attenuata]